MTEIEAELIKERAREAAGELFEESTIYLAGPIRFCDNGGHDWRNSIIEEYSEEYNFINPLDEHDGTKEEVEILRDPLEYDEDSEKKQILPSEIVDSDKNMISASDAVFVGLKDIIARGTSMEIMYSFNKDIPVFVWTMEGQEVSPWVRHHAEYISSDLEEVMEAVNT